MHAQVALTVLESNGIEAALRADDCGGSRPELQLSSGVKLLVNPRDRRKADQILTHWERSQLPEDSATTEESAPRARWPSQLTWFIVGLVVASLGWGYYLHYQRHRSVVVSYDRNNDKRSDSWFTYENGRIVKNEQDKNFDGIPDLFYSYHDGNLVKMESDQNFDGGIDLWQRFSNDQVISAEADINFDGFVDTRYAYQHTVLVSSEHDTDYNEQFDVFAQYRAGILQSLEVRPNGSEAAVRRERFRKGVLQTEWVDTNGDGTFDLERSYDPMGMVIAETKPGG
jgi:hypothetical protein